MDARLTPAETAESTPPTSVSLLSEEPAAKETTIRFRGVAALFRALDQRRDQDEDFAVAEGVGARAMAAIERARERRSTHERLHYRPSEQKLFISLPTRKHERVGQDMTRLAIVALLGMGVPLMRAYALDGATTYTAGGSGGSGEGDQVFLPRERDDTPERWPTLVVEVGVTQSPNDLRRKMAWWFAASLHQVRIVLLVKVVRAARTLLIDKYVQDGPPQRPGATTTRSQSSLAPPQRRQSITVAPRPGSAPADNLFDVVGAPLILEFALLFLRPADPARGERDVALSADDLAWLAEHTFE